jgi:hypothetical protein
MEVLNAFWHQFLQAYREPGLEHATVYALSIVSLLVVALLLRRLFGRDSFQQLERLLALVSHEQLSDIVLPKADDGEIHLDHVLLTEQGIIVIDLKDVRGVVFGGDRMQDWTVLNGDRRYTISNPQPALLDRVAAVKQVVTDVPVEGRIVFSDEAEFTKGVPSHVCTVSELVDSLPRVRRNANSQVRNAFTLQWDQLRSAAIDVRVAKLINP